MKKSIFLISVSLTLVFGNFRAGFTKANATALRPTAEPVNTEVVRSSYKDSVIAALLKSILTIKLFIDIARCSQYKYTMNSGNIHLKTAIAYIRQNYQKKLTVAEISAACGISAAHLQRTCKRDLGKNLLHIVNDIRLENVKYLLETSKLSNREISAICGFGSRQQLIYEFKKIENCTPSKYRDSQIKKRTRLWTGVNEKKITETEDKK
jgi:AraC-like DNA-binding protein